MLSGFWMKIRDPGKLDIPEVELSKKEIDLAKDLIEQHSSDFDLVKKEDEFSTDDAYDAED